MITPAAGGCGLDAWHGAWGTAVLRLTMADCQMVFGAAGCMERRDAEDAKNQTCNLAVEVFKIDCSETDGVNGCVLVRQKRRYQ